jgi:HEAT repeat protein
MLLEEVKRRTGPAGNRAVKDASLMVQFAAIEGLERARDPRALYPLLEQLLRWDNSDYTRECVAAALGELRRPEAIPALLEVAEEVLWDPHDPRAVQRLVARERERAPDDWQAEAGGLTPPDHTEHPEEYAPE